MIRITYGVGARPNFIKTAPVIEAIRRRPAFSQSIVHTGQHYDPALSEDILEDLGFPHPDRFLGVGSGTHAEQTGRVLIEFERVLLEDTPDLVVVSGDVNSTLGCALASAKLGIPVAHIEAGLRSFDWTMPEEINRVVTDRLSQYLFTHSPEAATNLAAEGIDGDRVHYVGNTMIDSLRRLAPAAHAREAWKGLRLPEYGYVLVTLHRPRNVDDPARVTAVADALIRLAGRAPVVFPVHPRTRSRLAGSGDLDRLADAGVRCLEPAGYLDFLSLQRGAGAVLTDSGGIQEEASVIGVPCYTLRRSTERPITVERGTNVLLGEDLSALAQVECSDVRTPAAIPLWDGHAGERVAVVLEEAYGSGVGRAQG